jgi:hypothetical protein
MWGERREGSSVVVTPNGSQRLSEHDLLSVPFDNS